MSIFDLKCMHQFLQGIFRFSVKYGQYLTTEGKVQSKRGAVCIAANFAACCDPTILRTELVEPNEE